MSRVMADCRRFESESNCTLTIVGEEDEVVTTAAQHAEAVHGHENTPELQQQIRDLLEPESGYVQGERQAEAFPG
jgi:predicted small metal-binding protein